MADGAVGIRFGGARRDTHHRTGSQIQVKTAIAILRELGLVRGRHEVGTFVVTK
jgi:hypothetical protein